MPLQEPFVGVDWQARSRRARLGMRVPSILRDFDVCIEVPVLFMVLDEYVSEGGAGGVWSEESRHLALGIFVPLAFEGDQEPG